MKAKTKKLRIFGTQHTKVFHDLPSSKRLTRCQATPTVLSTRMAWQASLVGDVPPAFPGGGQNIKRMVWVAQNCICLMKTLHFEWFWVKTPRKKHLLSFIQSSSSSASNSLSCSSCKRLAGHCTSAAKCPTLSRISPWPSTLQRVLSIAWTTSGIGCCTRACPYICSSNQFSSSAQDLAKDGRSHRLGSRL